MLLGQNIKGYTILVLIAFLLTSFFEGLPGGSCFIPITPLCAFLILTWAHVRFIFFVSAMGKKIKLLVNWFLCLIKCALFSSNQYFFRASGC
jgi:hypothetical protein